MTRRLLLAALPAMGQHASYEQEIAAYRVRRIEELKSGQVFIGACSKRR
jgi:hypothetical protein